MIFYLTMVHPADLLTGNILSLKSKIMKEQKYETGMQVFIEGEPKIITDVLPVLIGEEPVDYVYELDDDMEQRYNTKELDELIDF